MATGRLKRPGYLKVDDEGGIVSTKGVRTSAKIMSRPPITKAPYRKGTFEIMGISYTQDSWELAIKNKIYEILSFLSNRDLELYTNTESMKIWTKAFTHESINPEENYEVLEHFGDHVLKYLFTKYVIEIYPGLQVKQYSKFQSHYQERSLQGQMASKLGLLGLARIGRDIKVFTKIYGDIFESFFGALSTVVDQIFPGLGSAVCYNTIISIYENEDVSISKSAQDAKTRYVQIFQRFGFNKGLEEITENEDGSIQLTAIIPANANAFLRDKGFEVGKNRGKIDVATAVGNTEIEIRDKVYEEALATLERYGITPEWAEKEKKKGDLMSADHKLMRDAKRKAASEGYKNIFFDIDNKNPDKRTKVYELKGVTNNGKEVLLTNYRAENRMDDIEGRNQVLRVYLST